MWRCMLLYLLLSVAHAPSVMAQQEPKRNDTTEAGIDSDGNIYVASDAGKPLKMATVAHCIEAKFADDRQTAGCSVARGTKPEEAMQSLRLEIYMRNGKKQIIETETPMDQIAKIETGMKRRDPLKVLTTEGGLSTGSQRTYVYSECPYIKVTIRFKAANNEGDAVEEEPDDIIESISQPYLVGSVMD